MYLYLMFYSSVSVFADSSFSNISVFLLFIFFRITFVDICFISFCKCVSFCFSFVHGLKQYVSCVSLISRLVFVCDSGLTEQKHFELKVYLVQNRVRKLSFPISNFLLNRFLSTPSFIVIFSIKPTPSRCGV